MTKFRLIIALIAFVYINPSFVFCQGKNYIPHTIIVKIKSLDENSKANFEQKISLLSKEASVIKGTISPMFPSKNYGKQSIPYDYDLSFIYMIRLDADQDYWKCLSHMENLPFIKYAEPYYIPHILDEVNDPKVNNQYHLSKLQYIKAFDLSHGDTNIVIGIVDTGIDMDHPDLKDNIKINYNDPINGIDDDGDGYIDNYSGWDVAKNDFNPECPAGHPHGVYVAGAAAASTNNGEGIASIAYQGKLLPIKVANDTGALTAAYEGIVYAADHGCQIINCSWGGTTKSLFCDDIVNYATNYRGCVVIAAAGNSSNNTPYYPASCENVISVGATDINDVKWTKSTFGIELDVVAPGHGVYTTSYGGGYTGATAGTSFAAPIVSSTAALLMAHRPELNNLQIAEQLRVTCDIIDTIHENQYYERLLGHGRVNAYKALSTYDLPGLRITNNEMLSENKTLLSAGDTLTNYITITNYLAQATSTTMLLTDDSEYTTITQDINSFGRLGTLDSANNQSKPFRIAIDERMPYNHEVIFAYNMEGAGFKDYQQFRVLINQSFLNIQPNLLSTSFTSNGNIGYSNHDKKQGNGFIFNNLNLLFRAGLIIGNSSNEIVSAFEYDEGFTVNEAIDTIQNEKFVAGRSSFYPDTDKWDANLNITQDYKAYKTGIHNSTIFTTYTIVNNGTSNYNDLRLSLYTDWDISDHAANKAAYDASLDMLYTYSDSNKIAYAGICLLSEESTLPYCFDLTTGGNGGIDITENFSDEKKWLAMNNTRYNSGTESPGNDVASMFTCGPYNLNASDSIKLTFAIIAASNFYDLKEKCIQAKVEYATGISTAIKTNEELIYPNPAKGTINLPKGADNNNYTFYNSLGDKALVIRGEYTADVKHLPDGIYYVSYSVNNKKRIQKLIINR